MKFNTILKNLREEKGITQTELSKIINVSNRVLGYYESNRFPTDPEILIKIANYFEVSLDYLLGNEKIKPIKKELIDEEIKLIEMFRELPKEDRKETLKYIKFRLQENDENKKLSGFQKNKKKEA